MASIIFGMEFYFFSFPGLLAAKQKVEKEEGKQLQGSWKSVPCVRGSLPSAHKSLSLLTHSYPRKIALLCSEIALEGIITGLLPYLKNTYFQRTVRWASTRSPFLPRSGWRQQHGLVWGHWLPWLPPLL